MSTAEERARDIAECAAIVGMPISNPTDAVVATLLFGEDEDAERVINHLSGTPMSSIREQLKVRAAGMQREEEFEVRGSEGVRMLAVGLMTGDRNRLFTECMDGEGRTNLMKLTPRILAMTMCDPATRALLWNVNSLDDHNEINALPPAWTEHMQEVAFRVCGIGKDAVTEGKGDSGSETTNSSSFSPPALAVA
jgi:hypothetical protein